MKDIYMIHLCGLVGSGAIDSVSHSVLSHIIWSSLLQVAKVQGKFVAELIYKHAKIWYFVACQAGARAATLERICCHVQGQEDAYYQSASAFVH